jgi:5-methylcytosine-specific restriction protein B
MPNWIRPARVTSSIRALSQWRSDAKSQAAMHLWPLLALLEAKGSKQAAENFTEANEFKFWDSYGRYPDEGRERNLPSGFAQAYYIDPLLQAEKPSDYPHRGPWTIRTRTFLNSWKAAEFDASSSTWKLRENYADILVNKVLAKDGVVHRIPVVDLAIWLFRYSEFPDSSDAKSLERHFLTVFPFDNYSYDKLFEFTDEEAGQIFQDSRPKGADYRIAISQALIHPDAPVEQPAPLAPSDPKQRSLLKDDDPILQEIRNLLALGTSGIILRGCPGTSKTWYANQIAHELAAQSAHIFQVQFHPSYGYEDFVEGYVPDESTKSGFRIVDKVFLEACKLAGTVKTPVVVIIDEINRGDPARVLGELLTYIEFGYRNVPFRKAYTGKEAVVPPNLLLIGTMNQFDRSITQLDLALVRRLDHVDLKPSGETLMGLLENTQFTSEQIDRLVSWFEELQKILPASSGGIGHTYFKDLKRPDQLTLIWQYRMIPYCESLLELEPQRLENVKRSFEAMYRAIVGQAPNGPPA